MSHPDYVIFDTQRASKLGQLGLYIGWAKNAGVDLSKPLKCVGVANGFGGKTYKVLRNEKTWSQVGQDVFNPYLVNSLNLDDYL